MASEIVSGSRVAIDNDSWFPRKLASLYLYFSLHAFISCVTFLRISCSRVGILSQEPFFIATSSLHSSEDANNFSELAC